MKTKSIQNILFLLNLLSKKNLTKEQMLKEFEAQNVCISQSTLDNYIKKIKENNIELTKFKKTYCTTNSNYELKFTQNDIKIIKNIKKVIIAQKNYKRTRKIMRFFYRLSKLINNPEIADELIDFGYYSTLNWQVIAELEKHCQTKDIVLLDYILPQGGAKLIEFHTDCIKHFSNSNKLYLTGTIKNSAKFSRLPLDRVFMVKNVIRKNVLFDVKVDLLTFKVSKKAYEKNDISSREIITNTQNGILTVETPILDEFYLIQRLLSFCPDLFYISEGTIKNSVIEKLSAVRMNYVKN